MIKLNWLSKALYYIKLILKKPYLITRYLFYHHLGVILCIPINEQHEQRKRESILNINIIKTNNIEQIYGFYQSENRDSITREKINEWFDKNYDCFLAYVDENVPIAGMWIFKNDFVLNNTSGRTLSAGSKIVLDNDTIYGAYAVVNRIYRGKGVNHQLLSRVIEHYIYTQYSKLLVITGGSNGAYIKSVKNFNGSLVGITDVYNIFGIKIRRELFLDKSEKVWNSHKEYE